MSDFTAFVAAAKLGDQSILAQAQALAEEIPAGTTNMTGKIATARKAAIADGSEVRSPRTLQYYRDVALWAGFGTAEGGAWAEGLSFRGHIDAKEAGIGIDILRANPTGALAERQAFIAKLAADKADADKAFRAEQAAKQAALMAEQAEAREAALQAAAERQASRVAAELLRGPSAVAVPPQPMGSWTQSVEAARVAPVRVVSGQAAPVIESAELVQHSVAALILMSLTSRIEREGIQTDAETLALVEGLRAVADRLEARMLASR